MEDALCTVRYLAASLQLAPTSYDKQKCLKTLPNVPSVAKSSLVEKY